MKVIVFISIALMCIFGVTNAQGGCSNICPYNYDPKCGFNGNCYKDFSNECDFENTNCRSSGAFRKVNLAMCRNPSNRKCF
ncbi:U-Kazal-Dg21.2-like [Episyrphus balteatus]|uniref:U-Kazal-Dg21.2-like n=1 Tax=Episyrphus balteatus TaxID=286459 RepID=UPI00248583DF|nr:U-Kazal-Dg21.2-like [Episyrphus balteatus]